MSSFEISHDIHCDSDRFWTLYFDREFNRALYCGALNYAKYEVLEFTFHDDGLYRRVQFVPKLDVPGPVAKLMGPAFSCIEEGTFDRAARVFRWRIIPSTLSEKVHTQGVTRADASGSGGCRRVVHVRCDARVFAIGGAIEGALESNLRSGYDRAAAFTNEWVSTPARPETCTTTGGSAAVVRGATHSRTV